MPIAWGTRHVQYEPSKSKLPKVPLLKDFVRETCEHIAENAGVVPGETNDGEEELEIGPEMELGDSGDEEEFSDGSDENNDSD